MGTDQRRLHARSAELRHCGKAATMVQAAKLTVDDTLEQVVQQPRRVRPV